MKNKVKKLMKVTALSLLFGIVSCKKEKSSLENENKITPLSEKVQLQTSFAKILAKAVKSDENLRIFIKEQSLKQFDNDYDILYQLVKDVEINGQSFHEKLLKYSTPQELEQIENKLPLLTIFVPTVPNFNPNIWNTASESPLIAVANNNHDKNRSVSLYNETGKEIPLKYDQVPGFPVLVVKENERVIVNSKINKLASTKEMLSIIGVNKSSTSLSYSFIDEVFNGSIVNTKNLSSNVLKANKLASINGAVGRVAPAPNLSNPNSIDQVNVDAYNSGSEWHRDYVYYGITPSQPNGAFKHNYSEFITSFKFLNGNALYGISDQSDDPKANINNNKVFLINGSIWTEGNFEFRITVLTNPKNGLGSELTKIMSVRPQELFDVSLGAQHGPFFPGNLIYFDLVGVNAKEYHPNIELVPWDLENYGAAWKFIFYEFDNSQETTQSYENTTTYATNFGFDAQIGKSKVGPKFGFTATTTEKRTFSVKTTLTSDFLGEATLTFDQPIIIGYSNGAYNTREITTGNNISISVEPRKVF